MIFFRSIGRRLRAIFQKENFDREMSEEMRAHLDLATERNRAAGMDEDEARFAARRAFGGVDQIKERCREERSGAWLEHWRRDLRHAARNLWRAPGFSFAVWSSLVVCIGPNAATLSALYALALKPLPFPEPAELVTVVNVATKSGGQVVQTSTTQYLDFKAHADLFSGFATVRHDSATLDDENVPVRVAKDVVAADFFTVLGVKPVTGRFFLPEEEVAGRDRVLVLSQAFWESRYHADPGVIDRKVLMGGQPYTIVGVAPRSLESLSQQTCFFQPYAPSASRFDVQTRMRGDLILYARLKPNVSPEAGLAQLEALEGNFLNTQAGPPLRALISAAGYRLAIEPLRTGGVARETKSLWLLQGGALLVLLIEIARLETSPKDPKQSSRA